jgi:2-polyprenyl-3-methyl-5-hydroxy-6-metoxy-1,4-benzoquinol methylase
MNGRTPSVIDYKQGLDGGAMLLSSCKRCGLAWQVEVPQLEQISEHYDYMGKTFLNTATTPLLKKRIDRILGLLGQPGRLLEIGCGGGILVERAGAQGWDVWGTEISPSCVDLLRPMMGHRLHCGDLDGAPFEPESFDAAVMMDVIEHVADPEHYLEVIHRFLKRGGRLYLSTPNARGLSASLFGYRWRVFCGEHLQYFSPKSMRAILRRSGFELAALRRTNVDIAPVIWKARMLLNRHRAAPSAEAQADGGGAVAASATSGRQRARTALIDAGIEAANMVTNIMRIGDSLKVVAIRA